MPISVPRVFCYKLVRDYGFAPNPFHGFCTLGTCKPQIRDSAAVGDLIIGLGARTGPVSERIIYTMKVDEILSFDEYWNDQRFERKKPDFYSGRYHAFGDNIYHRGPEGHWIQSDSHHSLEDGFINNLNLDRDTHSERVLISTNFVYWGDQAIPIPHQFRNFNGDDIFPDGRYHRCLFAPPLVTALHAWFDAIPYRGIRGMPNDR